MRLAFKMLKIVGLLVGVLVVALAALLFITFSGAAPIRDGQRVDGVEVVKDSIVSAFIVDIDDHDVALVDAGNDRQAKPILSALARRGLDPNAVKAILLTHGDRDHIAGVPSFPQAVVMALEPDIPLIEGREIPSFLKRLGPPRPSGIKVARPLHGGESLTLGSLVVRVFAVPGHTKGSAAFLMRGVLFLGDSADATKDGKLAAGRWLFTANPAQNRASLRQLAQQIEPWGGEVKAIACAHSGMLTNGLGPLSDFAARDR
ncbi:MAG: MBL fold metallo-hydrolase [Polyangia bacterium]|jgi:glyoxylase-like metal-dependent hydrolase (beta-lactamase superfamily II)